MTRRPLFYGWYVLAASFLIQFLNAAVRFIIGVMIKPIILEFDWSRSAVSMAVLLNTLVYALSVVVAGKLYDRYGPKWVIIGSTVLSAAGYVLMANVQSLWELLLYYGVLVGAGFGGITLPLFANIVAKWFDRRRGLAVSLSLAGNCIGQFALIPVFTDMTVNLGWRQTNVWLGLMTLVLNTVLTLAIIRGDPQQLKILPYGRAADPASPADPVSSADPASPADPAPATHLAPVAGLAPPADPTSASDRSLTGAAGRGAKASPVSPVAPVSPASPVLPTSQVAPVDFTLKQAMRTGSFWLFSVAMFVCGSGDWLLTTHLVPMVTDYGISTATGASMLAWFGFLSLGGVLLAGPASDKIGDKIPIALTFGLRFLLFVLLLFFQNEISFWIFSLGFGLTFLATAPLTPTLLGRLYGFTNIGVIAGLVTTLHHVGGAIWAYLGGAIFDWTGGYLWAFAISAVMAAVAVVCAFFIRQVRYTPPGAEAGPGCEWELVEDRA